MTAPTDLDIRDFETVEEAIEYLEDVEVEGKIGDLRLGMLVKEVDRKTFDESEIDRRDPDLPVTKEDRTHQVLWLINEYGQGEFLSNFAVAKLSEDPELDPKRTAAASNALHKVGYVERGKDGRRVYHRITEKGKVALSRLGDWYEEPIPGETYQTSNAIIADWQT